jgi:hypothetical protein
MGAALGGGKKNFADDLILLQINLTFRWSASIAVHRAAFLAKPRLHGAVSSFRSASELGEGPRKGVV